MSRKIQKAFLIDTVTKKRRSITPQESKDIKEEYKLIEKKESKLSRREREVVTQLYKGLKNDN